MFTAIDSARAVWWPNVTRINAIAGNLANLSTTHNELGEAKPYQPRFVTFQTDNSLGGAEEPAGVRVSSVEIARSSRTGNFSRAIPTPSSRGTCRIRGLSGHRHDDGNGRFDRGLAGVRGQPERDQSHQEPHAAIAQDLA